MNFKKIIILVVSIITKSSYFYAAEQTSRSIASTQESYEIYYASARGDRQSYTNQLHSMMHQLQVNDQFLTGHDKRITAQLKLKMRNLIQSNNVLSMLRRDSDITGRSNEIINSLIPEIIHEIQDTRQRILLLRLTAINNVELDKYGNRNHK